MTQHAQSACHQEVVHCLRLAPLAEWLKLRIDPDSACQTQGGVRTRSSCIGRSGCLVCVWVEQIGLGCQPVLKWLGPKCERSCPVDL